jgi:hypothetical protein
VNGTSKICKRELPGGYKGNAHVFVALGSVFEASRAENKDQQNGSGL